MSDGPTFARIDPQPANNSNNNNNNNSNNDAIDFDSWITAGDDGIAAAPAATAAGGNGNGNGNTTNFTDTQIEAWRERERRQRSIRSFMMFLLMLLLMDGDEQNQRRHQRQQHRNGGGGLRGAGNNYNNYNNKNNNDDGYDLYGNRRHATDSLHRVESDMELYRARRTQDRSIEDIVLHGNHSRVRRLVSKNHGRDIDREIRLWAEEQKIIQTRAIYEQLLKDLIFEQPDGSYVKVLVASRSNNEAVMLVDDGPRVLLNAAAASVSVRNANVNANANNNNNNNNNNEHDTTEEEDALKDAMYKFDEFRDSELEVWHYPRNATGYYRGDWKIIDKASPDGNDEEPGPTVSSTASSKTKTKTKTETPNQAFASQNTSSVVTPLLLLPLEAEDILLEHLQNQADPSIGLHLLPPGMEMEMELESKLKSKASNHNRLGGAQLGNENQNENQNEDEVTTATSERRTTKDAETTSYDAFALRGSSNFNANANSGADALSSSPLPEKISLSKTSGKIAFQLYSKSVPTMKELSLIDGYVKLYNSNAVGYSTRRDILMRVHGVLVHSLGKLSLVANPRSRGRAALIVNGPIGTDSNSNSNSNSNTAKEKQRQKDEDNDNGNHNGKTEPTAGGKPLVSESHDGGDADRDLDLDRRRRLQELLLLTTTNDDANQQASDDEMVEEIRSHALKLFSSNNNNDNNDHVVDLSSYTRIQTEADDPKNSDEDHFHKEYEAAQHVLEEQNASALGETSPAEEVQKQRRRRLEKGTATKQHSTMEDEVVAVTMAAAAAGASASASASAGAIDIEDGAKSRNLDDWSDKQANYIYSKHVIPFPFAWDDEEQSLQHFLPASARSMSGREQSLELNAGSCEFEFNMDIQEEKWTIGQWKKLISRQMENEMLIPTLGSKLKQGSAIPSLNDEDNIYDDGERKRRYKKSSKSPTNENSKARKRGRTEEAWVMMINGTVVSPNCDFAASINTNAIRTDWETTTGKAINYSFFMMTICLTQIVLLMRQLLHTQTQSASMRVSLLCIGWHTVVDALLCLVHIYLSLVMQPLFTTFASVAFFKLLIFCVIEMKYMAIIVQARNAHNGINSTELLRRQIAMLHLRFYVALLGACLGFFYSENCRTLYMLVLYSFWVPQIVHNVITEAKKPMNTHYVYGMSLTRMVAPLYMFAVQGNFLKAIYPESPTNVFMCQLLVAWIGMQACILHAQSRFGARFFIPAQFLPPKYDYNRPIPLSVLQSHDETGTLSEQLKKEREVPKTEVRPLSVQKTDLSLRGGVARNRKDGKRTKGESCMTAETVTEVPKNAPCIECVICYNDIDTSNRAAYMIAPCDHIFHKDCLVQWMEVKMECPICRRHLPTP